ncbi:MAG: Flp pilus assembly complex ATPase component TadA [DPANN group archaeon]|nr:Flp pilus assembly complex ATPase component TadA [DPANN group archaeon]
MQETPSFIIENYGNVGIYQQKTFAGIVYTYYLKEIIPNELGELKDFLEDDNLEEIMYIGPKNCIKVIHKRYGMCNTNVYIDEKNSIEIINNLAAQSGKVINPNYPILNARLKDGSRINATLPPISIHGPTMTIRKFRRDVITVPELIKENTITSEAAAFLWCCIDGLGNKPCNILFSGGTTSGKTTNLNAFSMFIPAASRIITIEDTAELQLQHEHCITLETDDKTNITSDIILKNTLRMHPDRLIVGEVRGEEAQTLFNAMNAGQEGCMGTIPANTSKETINRVINPPMNVPSSMLTGLDLIIMQQQTISKQHITRHITEISEISGSENGIPRLNTIYKWNPINRILESTNIPSRLRTKISEASAINTKEFDKILKERTDILKSLSQKSYNIKYFLETININISKYEK